MPLPNHWSIFNLKSTPFFQDTLRPGDERFPTELFIGRRSEAKRILTVIGSGNSSRQAVAGAPGVGKTSLVQYVKGKGAGDHYLSYADPIGLVADDTSDRLLMRVLRYVHDTILVAPETRGLAESEPMQQARQLVNAFRTTTGGVNVSVPGLGGLGGSFGTGYQQGPFLTPTAIVPRLLALLMAAARKRGAAGVILHLNNLENLSDADASRAGLVLRDVRDVLLLDGYHSLLVGTPEAVRAAITPHPQLRAVFHQLPPLESLSPDDLKALLKARYHHLRLDPKKPVRAPITPDALSELHAIFAGDLRGLFLACDEAATEVLGYLGRNPATPMSAADIRAVLAGRYRTEMRERIGDAAATYLEALAFLKDRAFSQPMLEESWKVSQGMISRALADLQRYGYVRQAERDSQRRIQYYLTGTARIILDSLAPAEKK